MPEIMPDSVLKAADIQNAIGVVDAYIASCNGIYEKLDGTIVGLTTPGSSFNGESQIGYIDFYKKITPAFKDNLTMPGTSLMSSIRDMLNGIKQTLLDQVDTQLGDANRNPGVAASAQE